MKLSTSLLLVASVSAASATSDAGVYIFQAEDWQTLSTPPRLSPEEAGLIFAHRLGVSQYHDLGRVSTSTLSYINKFGVRHDSIFQDTVPNEPAELLLILGGASSETAVLFSAINPAFTISEPPSTEVNQKLVQDLNKQMGTSTEDCAIEDALNPWNEKCWNTRAKAIYVDLSKSAKNPFSISDIIRAQKILVKYVKRKEMNVMVVLMPQTSSPAKSFYNSNEFFDSPSETQLNRRQQAEEPITAFQETSSLSPDSHPGQAESSNPSYEPIRGVVALCHSSFDSCISATNNCSGHGLCYNKYQHGKSNESAVPACFTCSCKSTTKNFGEKNQSHMTIYWGGAACQKVDVSGPFWLIAIFSVVMVGLVSWAIGLLFSIGEEKLPGVIGAGVPSKGR